MNNRELKKVNVEEIAQESQMLERMDSDSDLEGESPVGHFRRPLSRLGPQIPQNDLMPVISDDNYLPNDFT